MLHEAEQALAADVDVRLVCLFNRHHVECTGALLPLTRRLALMQEHRHTSRAGPVSLHGRGHGARGKRGAARTCHLQAKEPVVQRH